MDKWESLKQAIIDEIIKDQQEKVEVLKQLLKEALPHVEQMANECSTGPIMSPIDRLVHDIEAAILGEDNAR